MPGEGLGSLRNVLKMIPISNSVLKFNITTIKIKLKLSSINRSAGISYQSTDCRFLSPQFTYLAYTRYIFCHITCHSSMYNLLINDMETIT